MPRAGEASKDIIFQEPTATHALNVLHNGSGGVNNQCFNLY